MAGKDRRGNKKADKPRSYFIEFLQTAWKKMRGANVEYRVACSGEIYNRTVLTADWRKSDITRVLLHRPFSIVVASRPFDSYPQELCVRLRVQEVREEEVHGTKIFLPDEDIVDDLCSVLSLLSRRLISPMMKVRQIDRTSSGRLLPEVALLRHDTPMPILDAPRVKAWGRRPVTILTGWEGQKVEFNDPPPVGVDPAALSKFLLRLREMKNVQEVLYAARVYRTALELIEERPDTAYLSLISVVETFANIAFPDFKPTMDEMMEAQGPLRNRAKMFGLGETQIRELVESASKGQRWLKRKFVKFCVEYCPGTALEAPDRVFVALEHLLPPKGEFTRSLGRIYDARSANLHVADPFPPGMGIGTSTSIRMRDLPVDLLGKLQIPPASWFERVVSIAARNFLLGDNTAPFREYDGH